jgi:hypothetical protein
MFRDFGGGVMNSIAVSADRDYEVAIDIEWQKAIQPYLVDRGQIAVIVSETMRDRIVNLPDTDAQVHVFTVPDSEAGKSFANFLKLLDWHHRVMDPKAQKLPQKLRRIIRHVKNQPFLQ